MQRLVLSVVVAACLPVYAQPRPTDKTVTAIASPDAAGGSIVFRNNSNRIVAALEYIYTMRNPDMTVVYANTAYYDSAIDPQNQPPLKPGQEVRVPYRIPFSGATPQVGAEAGLFADGGAFGEPHVIQTIQDRRGYTLVSLTKAISDLKQAVKDNLTRQELISLFQNSLMSEATSAGDSELVACIQAVRSQVLQNLIVARRPDGSPLPMADLVQSQVDALSQRRDLLRTAMAK